MNFAVLWLFVKVFSTKFGRMASFGISEQSAKVLSTKIVFFTNSQKFPVSRYTVYRHMMRRVPLHLGLLTIIKLNGKCIHQSFRYVKILQM